MNEGVLVGLKSADELHNCIDSQSHRVEIEDVRKLLGVNFVQTLLEHFSLL